MKTSVCEYDTPITDATALFYALSAGDLSKPGDTRTLILYSKDTLMEVKLNVEGFERIRVNYEQKSASGTKRIKGSKDALRVSVAGRKLVGDAEFNFFGLSGDVEIYLDPQTRVMLLMSGKIRIVGRGNIKLQSVTLE